MCFKQRKYDILFVVTKTCSKNKKIRMRHMPTSSKMLLMYS